MVRAPSICIYIFFFFCNYAFVWLHYHGSLDVLSYQYPTSTSVEKKLAENEHQKKKKKYGKEVDQVMLIIVLNTRPNQLLQLCTACTAWSESDQAVQAMHSCNSW